MSGYLPCSECGVYYDPGLGHACHAWPPVQTIDLGVTGTVAVGTPTVIITNHDGSVAEPKE